MGRENKTKFAVLGLLAWRGPLSGYQVKQTYESSADFFWSVSYGQIYPTLRQLEAEGLVTSSTERDEGRPERRIYAISERGRSALEEWLAEPAGPLEFRAEVLLKLLHGFRESPEVMMGHVARLKEQIQGSGATREDAVASLKPDLRSVGLDEAIPYWMLIARFGELMNGAIMQWCDEALPVLEKLKAEKDAEQQSLGEAGPSQAADPREER
ncbi:MAG TPA: helix-turn-helix transcriptional regulator [Coriobacteriia bacterium]|jgi:DNA-binding PadR family transcriptional regulator